MTKKTPIKKPAARKQSCPSNSGSVDHQKCDHHKKSTVKSLRVSPLVRPQFVQPWRPRPFISSTPPRPRYPRVLGDQDGNAPSLGAFASFEDVKDRAIDFLIDYIADCEQQLWDIERAESFEAYTALLAESERQETSDRSPTLRQHK